MKIEITNFENRTNGFRLLVYKLHKCDGVRPDYYDYNHPDKVERKQILKIMKNKFPSFKFDFKANSHRTFYFELNDFKDKSDAAFFLLWSAQKEFEI